MNASLLIPEFVIVGAGLALLLLDLFVPAACRRHLAWGAVAVCAGLFVYLVIARPGGEGGALAFGGTFVQDGLALFFKALVVLAAAIVLLLAIEWSRGMETGVTEYAVLCLLSLAGMMLAASANDFAVLYVSIELVTVTFYVLTSYGRRRAISLEAGVKYLVFGALSSAFMVYGIALCFGTAGTMNFAELRGADVADSALFQLGLLLVFGGLAFKVALFPFQIWTPDVYEGAPAPTAAFLAIGSKAAGVVLLVRLLGGVVPEVAARWETLLMAVAGISILYGSLCAVPQRGLKRLMGYSSIANAGFVMIGLSVASREGSAATLFYMAAYLFTVLAAFLVVAAVVERLGTDEIAALAGLHRRSPLLAAGLALSMISLAGVPPLSGFFGKFVVLAALVNGAGDGVAWIALALVAVAGVGISFWYYFGIVRTVYWTSAPPAEGAPALEVPPLLRIALGICIAGMLYLGVFPGAVWNAAVAAVANLPF